MPSWLIREASRIRKERPAKLVLRKHRKHRKASLPGASLGLAVLFLIILPATGLAQKPWKFIVTCDSRGYTNGIQPIILGEIVTEILNQPADFVLFPGDLVSGYASIGPAGFEAELRAWVEMMNPVYNAGIGVYVSRGNHEIMDVWGYYVRPDIDPKDNHATRWLNVFGNDLYPEQMLPDNGPAPEIYMT